MIKNKNLLLISLPLDADGRLFEDASLGECSPSFAGCVLMNQFCDGWTEWLNSKGQAIDIYRKTKDADEKGCIKTPEGMGDFYGANTRTIRKYCSSGSCFHD